MRAGRHAAAAFAALGLALAGAGGCATNPATGEAAFTGGMTRAQEIAEGRRLHPQVLAGMGGAYADPDLARYVDSIGQLLARTGERPDLAYTFTVLDSPDVNAFAIPGGYVYVTRGLLALAGDEAELAAVLAHELGHVTALHHARRHGQTLAANLALATVGALFGGGGAGAQRQAADIGGLLATGVLRGYSREHEYEADDLGIRYLARAGYDADAMPRFLARMRAHSRLEAALAGRAPDSVDAFDYLATHPAPAARVARARDRARAARVARPMTARGLYLDKIDGIAWGGGAKQGLVRGREFIHPGLRVRFSAPAGFRLRNGVRAVTARGEGGAVLVFSVERHPAGRSMGGYLAGLRGRGLEIRGVRRVTVNGMRGAVGAGRISGDRGRFDLRVAAVRASGDRLYRLALLSPPGAAGAGRAFDSTLGSLRRLTRAEAAAVRPLRLRVLRVRAGDSQASLARRMAVPDRALERFRVLNGLAPGDRLAPGRRVKIVAGR